MSTQKDFNSIVSTLDLVLDSMRRAGHSQVLLNLRDLQRAAKTTNVPRRKLFAEVGDALTMNALAAKYGTLVVGEVEGPIVVISRVPDMLPRATWKADGDFKFVPWVSEFTPMASHDATDDEDEPVYDDEDGDWDGDEDDEESDEDEDEPVFKKKVSFNTGAGDAGAGEHDARRSEVVSEPDR